MYGKLFFKSVGVLLLFTLITQCLPLQINVSAASGYRNGDLIGFGSYPQSLVEDENLLKKLNSQRLNWKSYGYYYSPGPENDTNGSIIDEYEYGYVNTMKQDDYMKYADVEYDGQKYRAVKFTEYRPFATTRPFSDETDPYYSHLYKDRKYKKNTVYWFRYDPLIWKIYDAEKELAMSLQVIDSQAYQNLLYTDFDDSTEYGIRFYSDKDCTAIANNYSTSSIREWLNDDFYNTAFSSYEQAQIKTERIKTGKMYEENHTEIDLSDAEITEDKVFLLSSSDLLNENYYFYSPYVFPGDISPECGSIRTATATEYAVCQGLTFTSAESYMNSWWNIRKNESDIDKEILSKTDELDGVYFSNYLIRTKPKFYLTQYPNIIDVGFSDSAETYLSPVNCTGFGVRPIIRLNLDNKSVTRIDAGYDKSGVQYDLFVDIMDYFNYGNKITEEETTEETVGEVKNQTVISQTEEQSSEDAILTEVLPEEEGNNGNRQVLLVLVIPAVLLTAIIIFVVIRKKSH